jgi:hypothetical protein
MKFVRLAVLASAIAIAGIVTAASGVSRPGARSLRWDFLDVNFATKQIVPGGTDTSKDAATGDTLSMTGTGQFTPSRKLASGGGSFVHKHADGSVVAQGFYYVTGFRSYRVGGGKEPKGFVSRVARGQGAPLDGILIMTIRMVPVVDGKPQAAQSATLRVNCAFEHNHLGLKDADEGFELRSGSLTFKPAQPTPTTDLSATVFTRLR